MRRKDREMDREFALNIIDQSSYGVVSMIDRGAPFGVPLSIVRSGDNLYFHSAKSGRKVAALAENKSVCVTFVGKVKIPELYTQEELKAIADDKTQPDLLGSNVFTTEFESAIVDGKVYIVTDSSEKLQALRLICEKYTPDKMDYFDAAVNSGIEVTDLYRIEIETITGKRKKFDAGGVEMKWGRSEDLELDETRILNAVKAARKEKQYDHTEVWDLIEVE